MSAGIYSGIKSQKKDRLGSDEQRTVLSLWATPVVPLPSMRDNDAKKSTCSEIRYIETPNKWTNECGAMSV